MLRFRPIRVTVLVVTLAMTTSRGGNCQGRDSTLAAPPVGHGIAASNSPSIPEQVIEGANAALMGRVGSQFALEYVALDLSGCRYWAPDEAESLDLRDSAGERGGVPKRSPALALPRRSSSPQTAHWILTYQLRIPSKPWVAGRITVLVDSTGAAVGAPAVAGIGDCVRHPEECTFSVDENSARRLAESSGLQAGLRPWKTGFQWVARPTPCYAWIVENALRLEADSCNGEGDTAVIDANTGRHLTTEHWIRTCDFSR